jgi:hypothetical protein
MKPTILNADLLSWVMYLLSDGREDAERGLCADDRWAVESNLGCACHGPVALAEYLHALQEEVGDRPAGSDTGLHDPAAWDALLRDGLPALPDARLLAVAASADTIRELNSRVHAALCAGTLTEVWWAYYEPPGSTDVGEPPMSEEQEERMEALRRMYVEFGGRKAPRRPSAGEALRPLLLDVEMLARVMTLLTGERAKAGRDLSADERADVEALVVNGCLGPAARDEYLAALAHVFSGRTAGEGVGLIDADVCDAFLRDGPPALSDPQLLAVAGSSQAIWCLNTRVSSALSAGTLTDVWYRYYKADAEDHPLDRDVDQRMQETVEVFRRMWAELCRRRRAAPPPPAATGETG